MQNSSQFTFSTGLAPYSLQKVLGAILLRNSWEAITFEEDGNAVNAKQTTKFLITDEHLPIDFIADIKWQEKFDISKYTLVTIQITETSSRAMQPACKTRLIRLVNEIEIASREQAGLTVY